jgi:hypothetical protein
MNRGAVVVFYVGLATWLLVQLAFVSGPVWGRALPPEVDDSYSYMLKAAQMKGCFWQECAALADLRAQMAPPAHTRDILWNRARVQGMVYVVYHPLYSLVLLATRHLVGSWETALKLLWTLGVPLFGVAFGWWLRVLWGAGAAGIALGLLAFDVFGGQGLHYVVPSNLTLGVAVLVWARLTAQGGRAPASLLFGTLVLVLMHPVGRIYATMAAMLALLLAGVPRTLRGWLPFVGAGGLVGGAFVLPLLVDRPEMRLPTYPLQTDQTWGEIAAATLRVASDTLLHWVNSLGMVLVVVALVAAGYRLAGPVRRGRLLATTLVVGGFLLLGFFYVIPQLPGELFVRLAIPFFVLLSGAVGQVAWSLITHMLALSEKQAQSVPLSPQWGRVVLAVLVVLLLFFPQKIAHGIREMQRVATFMTNRHAFRFDPRQPHLLATRYQPGEYVLHQDEFLLLFWLVHGGLYQHTLYTPVLAEGYEGQRWLETRPVRFAVIWDPVELLAKEESLLGRVVNHRGEILTAGLNGMRLENQHAPPSERLRVFVTNAANDGNSEDAERAGIIEVVPFDARGEPVSHRLTTAAVPPGWSGWIAIDLEEGAHLPTLQLRFLNAPMRVGGLVYGNDGRQWPWAQRATLTLVTTENETIPAVFDAATSLPHPLDTRPVTVLDDRGASVLLHVGIGERGEGTGDE